MTRALAIAFILLGLPGMVSAAAAPPANVLVAVNRTEPVLAVDPANPSIMVAGSNTNYGAPVNGTYPVGSYASTNGGHTFHSLAVPIHAPYTTGADPTVAIAQDGTVFFNYLGETPAYCSGGKSAIVLTHSIDHGRSYRNPVVIDNNPADDKPSMTVESVPGRPSHIFVSWTRWHNSSSDIWVARSTNGGATFSRPRMLYSTSLDNFGSVPVVGLHGRIYVFWSTYPEAGLSAPRPTRIMMRVSSDDGAHFSPARRVASFTSIPVMEQPGSMRTLPTATAAATAGGAVYLAWTQAGARDGSGYDANIELTRSADGGSTWSRHIRVNDATRGDRFMPALTALGADTVGLAFYDRRAGTGNLGVYATEVAFDGRFHVAPNRRVGRGSSPISDITYIAPGSTCFSPGRFFGDYIGVAAAAGDLCVVWADTQLHRANETDIWFARFRFNARSGRRRLAYAAHRV
ncbi:MAG TPA: sialidase family protein [Chloroflexota bacterium]|nr:sialidase family protein [Chloroflexota bacterium]